MHRYEAYDDSRARARVTETEKWWKGKERGKEKREKSKGEEDTGEQRDGARGEGSRKRGTKRNIYGGRVGVGARVSPCPLPVDTRTQWGPFPRLPFPRPARGQERRAVGPNLGTVGYE